MQPSGVEAKKFSLAVYQRTAGKSRIHGQVRTNELINLAAAPCAHGAADQAGENSRAAYYMASTRARQCQHQFTHAQVCGRSPTRYWGVNRLLQPQDHQV